MSGSEDKAPKNLKSEIAEREEKVLEFWNKNLIFKKTLEKEAPQGEFVFYDGPATANAKPVFHTMEPFAFKDIIPRYKTMRGYHVRRKGGWDTHGLPVELQIEKKLGFTSKKDIENFGIAEFNKLCKESVWDFIGLWKDFTNRMGYWADQENPYITYENSYIESLWNVLKTVDEKKLLYKDYKVLPWCPRCGTALSSHELAQGYQDDKDLSVTAKFKIKGVSNGYFLAWTTTPWTLPGNVALAVGENIDYVEAKIGEEVLVLAKDRLSIITEPYEIVAEHKGKEMLGMEYEPLYSFLAEKFKDKNPEAFEKSYKIYAADFVNTQEGTGIVHTAVMYGQDDFVLGTKVGLPKFHLVNEAGHFLDGMDFLSGRFVKDEEVAVDIVKDLAHRGLLFKKEKYEHSYPHCWRCKTPLIYYARDSWYIAMSTLRDKLVAENEEIHWEPEYIQEGRFGEWLREVKDWAISRERYWGTPLPVWSDKDGNYRVVGSLEELKKSTKNNSNHFIFLRHGEADSNVSGIVSCKINDDVHLTQKGKQQIAEASEKISGEKISAVYSSPFVRTKETAEIAADKLGFSKDKIIYDERLVEYGFGDFCDKSYKDFLDYEAKEMQNYENPAPNGESYLDSKKRFGDFIYDIDSKHKGETILVVTHGIGHEVVQAIIEGADSKRSKYIIDNSNYGTGSILEIDFVPLPHNSNYELDLHRPYIDEVKLVDENGSEMTRVKEVMDVWFDSGAMPFAQDNYPFSTEKILYPADYISEAIDQTRGWFYTLHAVGILMGKGKAFKNVICLGHILDASGKKMSKSVGNVVDPWDVMNKHGVDSLRFWMYSVNQPGDSKNFDEKTVEEITKKVFNPLDNIIALYELYKDPSVTADNKSKNILDKWILSRFNEMLSSGTANLDQFKIFEPTRNLRDFINDFSTWYVRRSRERLKFSNEKQKREALSTTRFILLELSKYMAPFTPFFAEKVYEKMKEDGDPISVHLSSWPEAGKVDKDLLTDMEKVRSIVSSALELRQKAGHKVRQPLESLTVKEKLSPEFMEIIKDEVNVKKVLVRDEIKLDTHVTEELKAEGIARDIMRAIQDARKTESLNPKDDISIVVCAGENIKKIIEKYKEMISAPTGLKTLNYSETAQKYKLTFDDGEFSLSIEK